MTCHIIQPRHGAAFIACERGKRGRKCSGCGARGAEFLCDGVLDRIRYPRVGGSKTCDAPMCRSCAREVDHDRHLCKRCFFVADRQLELTL